MKQEIETVTTLKVEQIVFGSKLNKFLFRREESIGEKYWICAITIANDKNDLQWSIWE